MSRAFRLNDPEAVKLYNEKADDFKAWLDRVKEDSKEFGLEPMVFNHSFTMDTTFSGFFIPTRRDVVIPKGWRVVKSRKRVEPMRGPEGDEARAWEKGHKSPGTPWHHLMVQYGLNTMCTSRGDGVRYRSTPGLNVVGDAIYAIYKYDELDGVSRAEDITSTGWKTSDTMGEKWEEIKVSEYFRVMEENGIEVNLG